MAQAKTAAPLWHNLGLQIAVSMVLGAGVGLLWPEFGAELKILGDIFLRLVRMAVAPLVFLMVTSGVAAAGDFRRLGKLAMVATVYFEIVSTIALITGFAAGMVLGVGKGLDHGGNSPQAVKAAAEAAAAGQATAHPLDFILGIFPDNFLGAFTRGDMLQVLVLGMFFGAALLAVNRERRGAVENGLNTFSAVLFQVIHLVMRLAPLGTFGAVAYAVASNGTGVLLALGWLVIALYLALLFFILVVLGLVSLVFGIRLWDLIVYIREEILIVLGTASSESVLPRLLEKLHNYGVSRQCVGLVLPTGYIFNLDGLAIYVSLGVAFLNNAYHLHLNWHQLLLIFGVLLVTSKGAATIYGGAFVVFAATVSITGILPAEGLPLMFGVYRLMSMAHAAANVVGNSVATIAIAKACGEYDPARRRDSAIAGL